MKQPAQVKRKQRGAPLQHLAAVVGVLLLMMAAGMTFIATAHWIVGTTGGDPFFSLLALTGLLMLPGLAMPGGLFVISFWLKAHPRLCRATIACGVFWGFAWLGVLQYAVYLWIYPFQYARMVQQSGVLVTDASFWISAIGGSGMYLCIFAICIFCLLFMPVR